MQLAWLLNTYTSEFKWVIINLFNVAIIVIVLQAKGIFALFLNTLKAESYNISLQTLY